jgi:fermentation-respiration switch protein FrsA (DUF1100 family)
VISLVSLIALGLVLLYAGLLAMLWWFQERVVFQPPAGVPPQQVPARRVEYRAADGVQLFAYVVGNCTADSTAMLAFHGNADLARWLVPWAGVVVRETGACVILPEYRGYDGANGSPTYAGSSLDAQAAFTFARDSLGIPRERMVFFGHSLGTAIAAELASSETPRSLVLQAPFSRARDMAARMFLPGLTAFWRVVSRVHFDTIERVRSLQAPVWVSHGDRDIIIPVRMGREVFEAAAEKGELLIVAGAGHNDVADVGGRDYWRWLRAAVTLDAR